MDASNSIRFSTRLLAKKRAKDLLILKKGSELEDSSQHVLKIKDSVKEDTAISEVKVETETNADHENTDAFLDFLQLKRVSKDKGIKRKHAQKRTEVSSDHSSDEVNPGDHCKDSSNSHAAKKSDRKRQKKYDTTKTKDEKKAVAKKIKTDAHKKASKGRLKRKIRGKQIVKLNLKKNEGNKNKKGSENDQFDSSRITFKSVSTSLIKSTLEPSSSSTLGPKVITFRDVNKVITVQNTDEYNESTGSSISSDFFSEVDANMEGRKRRYAKLMKKLEDSKKCIEIDLKEVVSIGENDPASFGEEGSSFNMEKIKEKLHLTDKKKYERLINYQRDQSKEEQKCFRSILPDKVDQVQANVKRQLNVHRDEKSEGIKKPRGRPRKVIVDDDGNIVEKQKVEIQKEKTGPKAKSKSKEKSQMRGFPVKFPKSLLPDPTLNKSRNYKLDKIRLGIVSKDGAQKVVELTSDTLRGLHPNVSAKSVMSGMNGNALEAFNSTQSNLLSTGIQEESSVGLKAVCGSTAATTAQTESGVPYSVDTESRNAQNVDRVSADKCSKDLSDPLVNLWMKASATTITLPSIESLEKDYELVSLSPASTPERLGNLKTDQFFIPQSTFLKDGKTSMIIVGPFLVQKEPKPRLVLVSPSDCQKGPPMILKKKMQSLSDIPPRNFRIERNVSSTFCLDKKATDKAEKYPYFLDDHTYSASWEMRDSVKRFSKGVARQTANVKFIDVKLENIREEDGQSVVTMKGDNVLKQVKKLDNLDAAPMLETEDGIPLIYTLNQIMTPALKRAEERAERARLAIESQKTGDFTPVLIPFNAMGDVVMEVLIPPAGTEVVPRSRWKKFMWFQDEEEELLPPLELSPHSPLEHGYSSQFVDDCPTQESREETTRMEEGAGEVNFINSSDIIDLELDTETNTGLPVQSCAVLKESSDAATQVEMDSFEEPTVKIENEAAVNAGPPQGLACCRLCLRLFPSGYTLFNHVRLVHIAYPAASTLYLEELRAHSRLACPICFDPPKFLNTPFKLRRHLQRCHGIYHRAEVCNVCQMEFLDKRELKWHMDVSHTGKQNGPKPRARQCGRLQWHSRSLLNDCISCNRCNIMLNDRATLINHTLTVHPELNQPDICRLCNREFDSPSSLRKHLKGTHEQTRSGALRCPFCPALLPDMDAAAHHKATVHSGAVPVHCPFCGAGYQSPYPMYNHIRGQHLRTESHVCPECNESFPSLRLLTEHGRRDHMMAPHVIKSQLRSAQNITYGCPFCTMAFSRTYELAVHVVNGHRDPLLPIKCHWCLQSFVSEQVMMIHMSGAHGVTVPQQPDSSVVGSRNPHHYLTSDHYVDTNAVTVVLEEGMSGADLYNPSHHSMGRHMLDARDMMDVQEGFMPELGERDQESVVFFNNHNQMVNISGRELSAGEIFDEAHLLSDTGNEFNLNSADYLETLNNDSITVTADSVADVMEGRVGADGGRQVVSADDMLGRFEVDGVLYEFASSEDPQQDMRGTNEDLVTINGTSLQGPGDMITIDTGDFAHMFTQVQ